jgi:hypothetical protein
LLPSAVCRLSSFFQILSPLIFLSKLISTFRSVSDQWAFQKGSMMGRGGVLKTSRDFLKRKKNLAAGSPLFFNL